MSQCVKVDILERLCDDNLEKFYLHFNYQLNLFYLKLYIIFSFIFYLKPSLQLSLLEPLAHNLELVPHIIVCPSVQFPFVPFQYPKEGKVQQSSIWARALESAAKEESNQREVRRTFKILRELWLNIGIEKINTYEGIMVKALLDSGAIGMFMDKRTAAKHGFRLQKLKRPIAVRNIDGMNNSGGAIIHQVEVNIYYKGYVERIRMNMCDLGKIEVILGIPWL